MAQAPSQTLSQTLSAAYVPLGNFALFLSQPTDSVPYPICTASSLLLNSVRALPVFSGISPASSPISVGLVGSVICDSADRISFSPRGVDAVKS